jgi:hypothetical protein
MASMTHPDRKPAAAVRGRVLASALLLLLAAGADHALASYAIYVGKNLSADGSVLIGGSGDEVSSHWLEVVPGAEHPSGSTILNCLRHSF